MPANKEHCHGFCEIIQILSFKFYTYIKYNIIKNVFLEMRFTFFAFILSRNIFLRKKRFFIVSRQNNIRK